MSESDRELIALFTRLSQCSPVDRQDCIRRIDAANQARHALLQRECQA